MIINKKRLCRKRRKRFLLMSSILFYLRFQVLIHFLHHCQCHIYRPGVNPLH